MKDHVTYTAPLTSIRFFAAVYVVLFHAFPRGSSDLVDNFVSLGNISVSFFFALSGFILAYVYLSGSSQVDRRKFWIARFARVYPLCVFSLLLDMPYLLLFHLGRHGPVESLWKSAVTLAGNCLMLQGWVPKLTGPLNLPVWSLANETFFYLLFPFLGVFLWKIKRTPAIFAFCAMYLLGIFATLSVIRAGASPAVYQYNPLLHLKEFGCGILAARLFQWAMVDGARRRYLAVSTPYLGAIALLVFGVTINLKDRVSLPLMQNGLLLPIYCLLLLSLAGGNRMILALFSAPWLVTLGDASYSIYLLHVPIFHYFGMTAAPRHSWFFPVYLLAVIAASLLTYRFLERPAREYILARFSPQTRSAAKVLSFAAPS